MRLTSRRATRQTASIAHAQELHVISNFVTSYTEYQAKTRSEYKGKAQAVCQYPVDCVLQSRYREQTKKAGPPTDLRTETRHLTSAQIFDLELCITSSSRIAVFITFMASSFGLLVALHATRSLRISGRQFSNGNFTSPGVDYVHGE